MLASPVLVSTLVALLSYCLWGYISQLHVTQLARLHMPYVGSSPNLQSLYSVWHHLIQDLGLTLSLYLSVYYCFKWQVYRHKSYKQSSFSGENYCVSSTSNSFDRASAIFVLPAMWSTLYLHCLRLSTHPQSWQMAWASMSVSPETACGPSQTQTQCQIDMHGIVHMPRQVPRPTLHLRISLLYFCGLHEHWT